jgi:hypothetical protein
VASSLAEVAMAKTRSARTARPPAAATPRSRTSAGTKSRTRGKKAPAAARATREGTMARATRAVTEAMPGALNPAAAVKAILDAQSRVAHQVWSSADAIVRQSFKLYERDVELIKDLKKRAEALAVPVKKSELVRAGLKALSDMQEAVFSATLKALPKIGSAPKAAKGRKAAGRARERSTTRGG